MVSVVCVTGTVGVVCVVFAVGVVEFVVICGSCGKTLTQPFLYRFG